MYMTLNSPVVYRKELDRKPARKVPLIDGPGRVSQI